jgi:hypothetical protein
VLERALFAATGHVTIDAGDLTFIDATLARCVAATIARTCVPVRRARPNAREHPTVLEASPTMTTKLIRW